MKRTGVRRGLLLLAIILAWLAIAGVGGQSLGKLSQVTSNDQSTFLPRSAESVKANEELEKFTDAGVLPLFLVLQGEQVYADAGFADTAGNPGQGGPPGGEYAAQLAAELNADGAPLSSWLAPGQPPVAIGAEDGSGVLVIYGLDNDKVSEVGDDGEEPLGTIVDDLRAEAADVTGAKQVHVSGPAGFASDIGEAFAGIDGVLLIVTLSVVLLILLIVYRSLVLPIFVLFSAVCGLSLAGYVVYRLADSGVLVVNGQSQGILSILVIGAATDYSLLLVARYREELERHESKWDAMKRAWRTCIEPIAASAGTVIAGLLCLLLSDLNSNRGLGPVGAIGIVAAVIASTTLLPALLLLGRWVFWPRVPHYRPAPDQASEESASSGLWARIAAFVERWPRRIWIAVSLVLLALCIAVPTFKAEGTSDADVFLAEVDSVTGQQVIDEHYEAGAADPIRVVTPTGDADEVAEELEGVDGVQQVTVGTDERDGQVIVDVVPADNADAATVVGDVRTAAHGVTPDALVGGDAAVKIDTLTTAEVDLQVIIPVVLGVVLLVLIALLRSIVAPVLLVAATVVSFGAAIGVAALVFNHVLDFPGADPAVPLLGFVFLVALGVDYSIFLMTRAREEVGRLGPKDGVTHALQVTGGVITSAGIVLAATFAALSVLPLLFMAQIAFIVAFGVLLDTLIVRSLLVPALAIDLGARTWWPSRLSRERAAKKEQSPSLT
ncbi:MMPL family transporter [Epidermidibacterium keratini]|uniref:MMPL family transporter n=1 Tax=Epidermidibacterium keratini TaxID=1891644 RepID=A0A7L4YMI5_9ACTN|nr:MMPL family transporter [Epidermidibacterium keratini]QHC00272.1 MMPL family transporter [Epidermidibacterium keratini]